MARLVISFPTDERKQVFDWIGQNNTIVVENYTEREDLSLDEVPLEVQEEVLRRAENFDPETERPLKDVLDELKVKYNL